MNRTYFVSLIAVIVVVVMSYSPLVTAHHDFLAQIQMINQEVEHWYCNTKFFPRMSWGERSDSCVQSKRSHWPGQMMMILQIATGVSQKSAVDMKRVIRTTAGLKHNNAQIQQEFLVNFGNYLAERFKGVLKVNDLSEKEKFAVDLKHILTTIVKCKNVKLDIDILLEYAQNELCLPFRPDSDKYFNFRSAIHDLIRLKETEKIDNQQFINRVVLVNQHIAPLYSAAMICQVIDGITGERAETSKKLNLELPVNIDNELIDWPYVDVETKIV